MQDEKEVRVVAPSADTGAAAGARKGEEQDRERHHCEAEQPVAPLAAPDQISPDDEPDEEVQRAGPARPGEPVVTRGLKCEERGLHEPTDADTPGREPTGESRMPRLAEVGDGGLAVGEEGGPEQQLSHLPLLS